VKLATAPVTWGVWEKTVGRDDLVPPELLLETMRGLGYGATELGPPGYFSPALLEQHELELVGGFAPLRFEDGDGYAEDVDTWLDPVIDVLRATGARGPVVLAGAELTGPHEAPDASYFERVNAAAERCRARDVPVVFHHHAGTYVESLAEIGALLEHTDVAVCYDTGHALAGGADPVEVLRLCRDRIEHVHLKDVDAKGTFCPFGDGEVDFAAVLGGLDGYEGWTVLEQDRIAVRVGDLESVRAVEASNLEFLRSLDGHSD
jgi:inosose dehydratase